MPVPIIELQRRLTIVGAVRIGGEKQPRRPGAKLEAFRLTSPRRELVEQAAALYGGAVSEWKSPVGDEWQVYTDAAEIPVLVMPGYSLRQTYELWEGATKRLRLCDGIDEELSGGPCVCEATGDVRCDLYTRLVVALPELDTVLGWRLISRGANAAHELPTMLALAEAKATGQAFVPAKLRLDQRRGVKDGQVVRFVVPVLDLGIAYVALAQGAASGARNGEGALGYEPAIAKTFAVEAALGGVSTPRTSPREPSGKTAALGPATPPPEVTPPLPTPGDEPDPAPPPASPFQPPPDVRLPVGEQAVIDAVKESFPGAEEVPADEVTPTSTAADAQTRKPTKDQKTALDALVGRLRREGVIATYQLWRVIAKVRGENAPEMSERLGGVDAEGALHWAPLRDSLTRVEAHRMIDWLKRYEAETKGQS